MPTHSRRPARSSAAASPDQAAKNLVSALCLAALLGSAYAPATAQTLTQIPIITDYAGNGSLTTTSGGDGGLATAAGLNNPEGIAYDGKGNTYISDYGNQTIRVINSSGVITTVFGTTGTICPNPTASSGACGDGGAASAATFKNPTALQFDTSGNLYIADYNDNRIRKITATNGVISGSSIISTVAGNGTAGFTGTGGAATSAELDEPHGLAVDSSGDLFISNQGTSSSGCTTEYVPAANQTLTIGGSSTSLTAGHIYVIAGQTGTCGYISDSNGTTQATASQLNAPTNIALDSSGNLYIADLDNARIRKVTISTGVITTVAGNGTACPHYTPTASPSSVPNCGDGGAATSANLAGPAGVFIDAAGNIIIGDSLGARVRKVNTSGTISTIGGTSQQCTNLNQTSTNSAFPTCGDGGAAISALISFPVLVSANPAGTVFFVDQYDNKIREIANYTSFPSTAVGAAFASQPSQNILLQVTGGALNITSISAPTGPNGEPEFKVNGTTGCTVGSGSNASGSICTVNVSFNPAYVGPRTGQVVAVTSNGTFNFGVSGVGLAPLAVLSPGTISTVAGIGVVCSSPTATCGDGGSATAANFNQPVSGAFDSAGNFYIADSGTGRIREVTTSGAISTVAGGGSTNYVSSPGGLATSAQLSQPSAVAFDAAGNMYIADSGNHVIARVDAVTKDISVYAGTGALGFTGDGGLATSAELASPYALFLDTTTGNLYIADNGVNSVRMVSAASGIISGIAGSSTGSQCLTTTAACGDGGLATAALLNGPEGIALDGNGNLYIADTFDNRVRRVDGVSGIITTVAGTGTGSYSGDGSAATSATLYHPNQVATDAAGDLYIADYANHAVRFVSASSDLISTIAGTGTGCVNSPTPACGDGGPATSAGLDYPTGVALDPYGNLYVTEDFGYRVRKVTTNPATLAFTSEPIGTAAPTLNANLYNIGNETLTYSIPSSGSNALVTTTGPTSASSSAFGQSNSTTCGPIYSNSGTTTLASGANCLYTLTFQPDTAAGNYTGTLVETDNSLNSGSGNSYASYQTALNQTINLTGTATQATPTVVVNSNLSPSLLGQSVTFTATVTGQGVAPTGTVTFTYVPAGSSTPVTVGPLNVSTTAGVTTATFSTSTLPLGANSISAQYNGDTNYTSPPAYTITQNVNQQSGTGDTVTAASATISAGAADQLTFAIPVVTGVSVPTGTVAFSSGGNTLTTATWPVSPVTGTCPPSGPGSCYLLSPTTAPTNIPIGSPTTVTATFAPGAGSGYAAPGTAPTASVTVNALADTITVTSPITSPSSPDAVLFNSGPVTITASSTSGQALTYTSTTLSVCTVTSPGGVVATLSTGTCTISVSQAAAGNYAAATTQTVTINVSAGTNTISFPALANTQLGATPPVPAATATSGVTPTYTSSTPSVCTVTTSGVITDLALGTCTITAAQAATGNFAAATSVSQSFTVTGLTDTITVTSPSSPDAVLFNSGTVPITAHSTSGQPLTYTSTTPSICSVSSTGVVTTLATGTCTISLTQAAAGNYAAATAQNVTLNVGAATNTISFPALTNTAYGATPPVPAATATSGVTPTYTSSTPSVCTVSSGGAITDVAVGTCTITAAQAATGNFAAATSVSQSFNFTPAADTITIPGTVPSTAAINATVPIGATTTSGVTPTYTSTTPTICSVSSTGVVTTLTTAGVCSISVTQPAAGNYAAATPQTVTITVGGQAQTIQNFGSAITATYGGAAPALAATATSGLAPAYTATGSACSVSSSGTVTLLAAGTCQITASQAGNGTYAAATPVTETLTVNPAANAITIPGSIPASAPMGGTVSIGATTTSGVTPTYTSTTPTICSVSSTGVVTTLATGTCSISVTQAASGNYAAATPQTVTIAVAGQAQTIQNFGSAITATFGGAAPTLAATTTSGLAPTYTATGSGCSVTSSGTVTLLAAGTCQITASQAGNSNYAAATPVSETLTVNPAANAITVPPTVPASVTVSMVTISLGATATSGAPVTYTSTTPSVCSVTSPGGAVTVLSTGTCTITVSQPATGNFAAATTQTVNINIVANAAYDFTIAANAPLSQMVLPGGAVVYTYALAPVGGQYPGAVVTYTTTGLPPGATYTLTPATGTVTATGGPQTLTLTVTTAQAVALERARQSAPWTLALLLPLLAMRKQRRRLAQAMTMLMLLAVGALAVTGCGNPHGFFGEPVENYTITVTATSGSITHSAAAVTLEVQ